MKQTGLTKEASAIERERPAALRLRESLRRTVSSTHIQTAVHPARGPGLFNQKRPTALLSGRLPGRRFMGSMGRMGQKNTVHRSFF